MIEIPLTKGYTAIVDDADKDLTTWKWHRSNGYAQSNKIAGIKERAMHRVIMERMLGRKLRRGEVVDHINRQKHDNRRSNLRIATHSQNHANKPPRSNKSGYPGVNATSSGKWSAHVSGSYLGVFDTPELAYAARCKEAKRRWGEFFTP